MTEERKPQSFASKDAPIHPLTAKVNELTPSPSRRTFLRGSASAIAAPSVLKNAAPLVAEAKQYLSATTIKALKTVQNSDFFLKDLLDAQTQVTSFIHTINDKSSELNHLSSSSGTALGLLRDYEFISAVKEIPGAPIRDLIWFKESTLSSLTNGKIEITNDEARNVEALLSHLNLTLDSTLREFCHRLIDRVLMEYREDIDSDPERRQELEILAKSFRHIPFDSIEGQHHIEEIDRVCAANNLLFSETDRNYDETAKETLLEHSSRLEWLLDSYGHFLDEEHRKSIEDLIGRYDMLADFAGRMFDVFTSHSEQLKDFSFGSKYYYRKMENLRAEERLARSVESDIFILKVNKDPEHSKVYFEGVGATKELVGTYLAKQLSHLERDFEEKGLPELSLIEGLDYEVYGLPRRGAGPNHTIVVSYSGCPEFEHISIPKQLELKSSALADRPLGEIESDGSTDEENEKHRRASEDYIASYNDTIDALISEIDIRIKTYEAALNTGPQLT